MAFIVNIYLIILKKRKLNLLHKKDKKYRRNFAYSLSIKSIIKIKYN